MPVLELSRPGFGFHFHHLPTLWLLTSLLNPRAFTYKMELIKPVYYARMVNGWNEVREQKVVQGIKQYSICKTLIFTLAPDLLLPIKHTLYTLPVYWARERILGTGGKALASTQPTLAGSPSWTLLVPWVLAEVIAEHIATNSPWVP